MAGRLDPLQTGFGPFDRLYEAADGWVCVVAHTDAERETLLDVMGVARVDDEYLQADALATALAARDADEAVSTLSAAGVAAAVPVGRNMHTFLHDPEQRRYGRVAEVPHPLKGNVRELHVLVRVSHAEQLPHRLAPELGEHTDEILSQVGYRADEIADLRAGGAVR